MQVQVHTDNHIEGSVRLTQFVEETLADSLRKFGDRVMRVEVHLADENSAAKRGDADLSCTIEARLAGRSPVAVSHHAPAIDLAISGAVDRLEAAIDRDLGRRDDAKGRTSAAGD
jgi:ribosome-associated translation inhibitor RaiA